MASINIQNESFWVKTDKVLNDRFWVRTGEVGVLLRMKFIFFNLRFF